MPPQQAWASRQFADCPSTGKSRAVQCKWCQEKKVAYNSTTRKTSHLKQCTAFSEHVDALVRAENDAIAAAGGNGIGGNIELEKIPRDILEAVGERSGVRRVALGGQRNGGVGMGAGVGVGADLGDEQQNDAVVFGAVPASNNSNMARLTSTPRPAELTHPPPASASSMNPLRLALQQHIPQSTTTPTQAARSSAYNRAAVDRAFASAVQDSGVPLNAFNATSHPAMVDALRLLDKETRVRIARELLDEAYEEVKRAVDNYIEKQQYLNSIVDDGELGDRNGIVG